MRPVALVIAAALTAAVLLPAGPARPASRSIDVPVLMYHRVGSLPPDPPAMLAQLTVQPRVFAAQMRWLARHHFQAITPRQLFDALEKRKRLPARPVLITFDDGYRNVRFNAAPVLHRLGMPATAFVITGRLDGADPSFLTWRDVRALERDGFTIGSHTVHHIPLSSASPAQATRELTRSRATLERHLGHPVEWFAYPYGSTSAAVVTLVHKSGYLLAFTTQKGATQYTRAPLLLSRYEIARDDRLADFAALLNSRR